MTQLKDLLAVKLEDGRTICVSAPYGRAFEGFLVETTSGHIGRVVQVECARQGDGLEKLVSRFATIFKAKNIWSVSWQMEAGVTKDA